MTYGGRGVNWFRGSRTRLYRPETMCPKKIVLKFKSIVMRTTNNVFRKVHNCGILSGDLLSLNENVIFWFFLLFSIFWTFSFDEKRANFKAQNRRLVPRFKQRVLYHVKERYLFFQNLFSKLWATEKKIFEAEKDQKYLSGIGALHTQRADAKNSEKCNKKSVWATVV